MKKLLYAILIIFSVNSFVISQPCLPEGITFSTQQEIDSFSVNYPSCTEIEGDVIIKESSSGAITNLNGLSQLTSIWGNLSINNNKTLTVLSGLDHLASIRGVVDIRNNDKLTSLSGLNGLSFVWKGLYIEFNSSLTSLSGLNNVTSNWGIIGIRNNNKLTSLSGLNGLSSIEKNLYIESNPSLTSLSGLDNFTSIKGILVIKNNDKLTSLSELNNLTSIGGKLYIGYNNTLTSLSGLDNLTSIGGELSIEYNKVLTSLSGIKNIDPNTIKSYNSEAKDLEIYNNSSLSECEVQSICDFFALPPYKTIKIYGNMTGCNSRTEIEAACSGDTTSTSDLEFNGINIYPNPTKDNFTIDFSGTNLNQANVTIFDLSGKQKFTLEKLPNDNVLYVNSVTLNPGLYFIRIKSEKFGTSFRKVMIGE